MTYSAVWFMSIDELHERDLRTPQCEHLRAEGASA